MPVFRPVIGFDKQEIVDLSEKIGTFETSIQPFEDCCTIFVAKHPVTKPNLNVIRGSETHLQEKIGEMVQTAIDTAERITCQAKPVRRQCIGTIAHSCACGPYIRQTTKKLPPRSVGSRHVQR